MNTTQEIQTRHDDLLADYEDHWAECDSRGKPTEKQATPIAHGDCGVLLKRLAGLAAYARSCEALGLTPKAGVLMRLAEGKS